MLKNILDVCGSALAFFATGFAFSFGGDDAEQGITFVGTEGFLLIGNDIDLSFWFFQFAFAATAATTTSMERFCFRIWYVSRFFCCNRNL